MAPSLWAEDDACSEMYSYYSINVSTAEQGYVIYDLSRNHTIEPPYVDSVLITSENKSVVLTSHAQSGERIDISGLNRGYYILWAFVGDCPLGRMFICLNPTHTKVEDVPENQEKSLPWKKIQDGVVVIETESGIYTVNGEKK